MTNLIQAGTNFREKKTESPYTSQSNSYASHVSFLVAAFHEAVCERLILSWLLQLCCRKENVWVAFALDRIELWKFQISGRRASFSHFFRFHRGSRRGGVTLRYRRKPRWNIAQMKKNVTVGVLEPSPFFNSKQQYSSGGELRISKIFRLCRWWMSRVQFTWGGQEMVYSTHSLNFVIIIIPFFRFTQRP